MPNKLPSYVEKQLAKIKKADILISVPSFNNASTIGHVMRAVRLGVAKYFPKHKAIILNSDCGSTDGTREAVRQSNGYSELNTILINSRYHPVFKEFHPPPEIIATYEGVPGKGAAFRIIFEIAQKLKAKACATVDADLRSITPEWVQLLVGPVIYQKFDLVLPHYYRHKYDATITNSIIYPLTRTLFGIRVRQPIGGDIGLSKKLIDYCLKEEWNQDIYQYGIDIFITITALANHFNVCQSFLGTKIHDSKDPKFTLGPMFRQVIGTFFRLIAFYKKHWERTQLSRTPTTFGFLAEAAPAETKITIPALIDSFKKGVTKHASFWASFMDAVNLSEIKRIARLPEKYFYIPDRVWVKAIYDFVAFTYSFFQKPLLTDEEQSILDKTIGSLTDLYFGWVASYARQTQDFTIPEAERRIEELCAEYEKLKPYLIKKINQNA